MKALTINQRIKASKQLHRIKCRLSEDCADLFQNLLFLFTENVAAASFARHIKYS